MCSVAGVILRLEQTNYTWNEGAGEVSVVIELIGINERVVSIYNSASQANDCFRYIMYSSYHSAI